MFGNRVWVPRNPSSLVLRNKHKLVLRNKHKLELRNNERVNQGARSHLAASNNWLCTTEHARG